MDQTMTELCQELRNWFVRERYIGHIEIAATGEISCDGEKIPLAENQYYRVIGSIFADGVHRHPDTTAIYEDFSGAVWTMAVPATVINLADDITAWRAKYEAVGAESMSPFMSESFRGYSYSKGSSYTGTGSGGGTNWRSTFASRMNAWRKL